MSSYKYPFITGGKNMVAATLGACSYIRATGYFNKAISYYAQKYNVNEYELTQNVRARQAAGQKKRAPVSKGKKYKWFLICQTVWCEADGVTDYDNPVIVKGLSKETVHRRFTDSDWYATIRNDYGGSYAPVYGHQVIAEFDNEHDAVRAGEHWKDFIPNRY